MKNCSLKIIVFLTLVFAISTQKVSSQIDTVSLCSIKLKGMIKSVSEVTFSAKDSIGVIVKDEYLSEDWNLKADSKQSKTNFIYEFDKNSRNTRKVILPQKLSSNSITDFKYNSGLLVESLETMVFSDATIPIKKIYKYDPKKNLTAIYTYRFDELLRKKMFKYDLKNNLIENIEIDKNGDIDSRTNYSYENNKKTFEKELSDNSIDEKRFKYNSDGNLIYESFKWGKKEPGENDILFETNYFYDNNQVTQKKQLRDEIETWKESFEYLNEKLSKESKIFKQDSSTFITKSYKYNLDGSVVIETIEKDKKITEEYDKDKNPLRLFYSFNDGKIEEYMYQYSFDKNSNWTEIIEFKNTVPLRIRIRKIAYY